MRASGWGPGPAKWRSKSNGSSEPEPQRPSAGGRLRAPASPRLFGFPPRRLLYRTLLSPAQLPHPDLLLASCGLCWHAGLRLRLVKGARTHCRRRCARAAGTKTPPPAPAPAPARSAGQARRWAPCGDPGQGAVQGLRAPGRCLRNARTSRSPIARTWQLSPEISTSTGKGDSAHWVGRGHWDPPSGVSGEECAALGL